MTRLFIPLKTEYFEAFEKGIKAEEYRLEGPRWNAATCTVGRAVTLSNGYTKRRLRGVIASYHTERDPAKLPGWTACYGNNPAPAAVIGIRVLGPEDPDAVTIKINTATVAKKRSRGLCTVPFCRRMARVGRCECNTHRDRRWRAKHPMRYLWKTLKSHAKARDKEFTITFEQWVKFCIETDYHLKVGTKPGSATVDRIDPDRGYHADNIRVLDHYTNSVRQDAPPEPEMEPTPEPAMEKEECPF